MAFMSMGFSYQLLAALLAVFWECSIWDPDLI